MEMVLLKKIKQFRQKLFRFSKLAKREGGNKNNSRPYSQLAIAVYRGKGLPFYCLEQAPLQPFTHEMNIGKNQCPAGDPEGTCLSHLRKGIDTLFRTKKYSFKPFRFIFSQVDLLVWTICPISLRVNLPGYE
ncbi:hypothetical protein GF1_30160 [Desulfolithobacter dissulfuricans]|uniref:Uncharacterized protein n=1 Tax=Desulfolithobacter dissulfuricans TaxID=2795293 RepID=A0A915UBF2_9BACT|nr:hypothetical protein GF1_30160 [Desulfolithobacter dissulfuricans]